MTLRSIKITKLSTSVNTLKGCAVNERNISGFIAFWLDHALYRPCLIRRGDSRDAMIADAMIRASRLNQAKVEWGRIAVR